MSDVQQEHRKYHPVASMFPLMQGEEFDALKADIATNGLLEPIWLHPDGSIIDGRNRHRACLETGTPMQFETWNGQGSLVQFVVSLNLHRRHLTASQRAAIAPEIKRALSEEIAAEKAEKNRVHALKREAEKRQEKAEQNGQGTLVTEKLAVDEDQVSQLIAKPGRDAREETASLIGINHSYVSEAETLERKAPDLLEEVKAGTKSIPQAKREFNKRRKKQAPPLPKVGVYRVIYADPPWQYGNSGVIGKTDNYGRAERHYPTMSISELCGLGTEIKGITEDDAVLFLWVTSPLLAECFEVVDAWGFKYKTSFVWNKVRHNYGHYSSVRHELLLVCTKGSCTPDADKKFNSVQTIERTDKHSEKPEQFREIIDTLYPHGNRIELFARSSHEGWDAWGNE